MFDLAIDFCFAFINAGLPVLTYDKTKCEVTKKAGVRHVVDIDYTGVPTPSITWKKDGKPMDDLNITETRDSFTQLTISQLELSHSGSYTVTAENSVGRDTATFTLEVRGEWIIISYSTTWLPSVRQHLLFIL